MQNRSMILFTSIIIMLSGCASYEEVLYTPPWYTIPRYNTLIIICTDINIGDAVESYLSHHSKWKVISRSELRLLLSEHSLSLSSLMDPDRRPEVGKVIGANLLLFIDVLEKDTKFVFSPEAEWIIKLSYELIDVQTGQVLIKDVTQWTLDTSSGLNRGIRSLSDFGMQVGEYLAQLLLPRIIKRRK